jgi:hypothetical protein
MRRLLRRGVGEPVSGVVADAGRPVDQHDARPAVCMRRLALASPDHHFQHASALVLEDHSVRALARAHLDEVALARDTLNEPTEPRARALLDQYIAGFENADMAALEQALRTDAAIELVGTRTWFSGCTTCLRFLRHVIGSPNDPDHRQRTTRRGRLPTPPGRDPSRIRTRRPHSDQHWHRAHLRFRPWTPPHRHIRPPSRPPRHRRSAHYPQLITPCRPQASRWARAKLRPADEFSVGRESQRHGSEWPAWQPARPGVPGYRQTSTTIPPASPLSGDVQRP